VKINSDLWSWPWFRHWRSSFYLWTFRCQFWSWLHWWVDGCLFLHQSGDITHWTILMHSSSTEWILSEGTVLVAKLMRCG